MSQTSGGSCIQQPGQRLCSGGNECNAHSLLATGSSNQEKCNYVEADFPWLFLGDFKNKWCMLMMMKYTWWDKFPPVYANKFFVDVLYASIYYSEVQTCRQIHVSVRTLKHLHSKTASFIINPYHRWTPSEADCRLETLFITAEMAFPTSVLQLNSPHCSHRASLPFLIVCHWKIHKLISLQHRSSLFCLAESSPARLGPNPSEVKRLWKFRSMSNLSLGMLGNAFSNTPTVTEWIWEY